MRNFAAVRAGQTVAVSTVAAAVALAGTDANAVASAQDVLIDNRGTADAFVLFGGPDVSVSVATGVRVPAGAMAIYGKANATHIAVLGQGITSLALHLGEGV